jgi:hypothetical protein
VRVKHSWLFVLMFLAPPAFADVAVTPASCNLKQQWSFEEIYVVSNAEPQVIVHQCFSTETACIQAQQRLAPGGFFIFQGGGETGQSSVLRAGRYVTPCFETF